jgi:cytochrome c553
MTHAMKILLLVLLLLSPSLFAGNTVAGDAERGRRLHTGEETIPGVPACNSCHGTDGNQTQAATFPRIAGQYPEYLVHALQAYKSGARKNAVMQPMASALSSQDMDDLATFFGSLSGDLEDLSKHVD